MASFPGHGVNWEVSSLEGMFVVTDLRGLQLQSFGAPRLSSPYALALLEAL